jgi:hypothetical protein
MNTRRGKNGYVVFKNHFAARPRQISTPQLDLSEMWDTLSDLQLDVRLVHVSRGIVDETHVAEVNRNVPGIRY